MAELVFFRHGEEMLRVTLGPRTVLGRGGECDVFLPDPQVSRQHAVIEKRPEGYFLVDQSGKGTRVGTADTSEAKLADGVEIALGTWRALFRSAGAAGSDPTIAGGSTEIRKDERAADDRPAKVRVKDGGPERTLTVPAAGLSVGKDPDNDVVLTDRFVSAHHLRVERRGGRWWLRDLGSTNGTLLYGSRVDLAELPPGTPIRVGDAELVLEVGDEREARPSAAFEGMISGDPAMRQVFEMIERVAPSEAPVTILGETGTGKELVARAIHARSSKRQGPFIPVNCSAIAESLIESELFGHEKGAFSGADRARKGAFEEADGGSIFLDEIGELPLDLQPKLLRALELGEVKRVGASRPIYVQARIIAATHRDLRAAVRSGKFREDLYYRLCVVPISVPPLRQRKADVRALAEHYLKACSPRGLRLRWAEDALRKLEEHDWPGNVRQLKNVVQRALLFRGEGLQVAGSAITFDETRIPGSTTAGGDNDVLYLRGLNMVEIEREAIRLSLRRHHGLRSAVVKELEIAKSTVMKRIGQYGMQAEGREGGAPAAADDEAES
jgi:DNA-binding NtrC family response regulator